tara:strand:- start:55268 stop:56014 length:747 start_codon:yes stop_codon:yes gene_type:complete
MEYKDFKEKGFQVFHDVLEKSQVDFYKNRILDLYEQQKDDFGEDNLKKIGEDNTVRSPFLQDQKFQYLFYNDFSRKIVEDILGDHAILSLQNGIFIPPMKKHHQSFFHRDLIYQEFTSSRPLSINLYYCLDDYNESNGGTSFIPGSHMVEKLTSYNNEETPGVEAGSVILFDSMVYHSAGDNKTNQSRCGVNNMFTLPFIKQQIKYPHCLRKKTQDDRLNRLLGFESNEFLSVMDFRTYRLNRNNNAE